MNRNDSYYISILYNGIPQALNMLRGLVVVYLIVQNLGETAYGVWTLFITSVLFITPLLGLNLGFSMNRFLPGNDNKIIREDFGMVILVLIPLSLAFVISIHVFGQFISTVIFSSIIHKDAVLLIGIYIIFQAYGNVALQLVRSQQSMRLLAFLKSTRITSEILAIALVSYFYGGINQLVYGITANNIFVSTVFIAVAIHQFGLPKLNLSRTKKYLRYGLVLLPSNYGFRIATISDRYLVSLFLGIQVVAAYNVVYSITTAIAQLSGPITEVLFPSISNLKRNEDDDSVVSRMSNTLTNYLVISLPALFGITAIADPLIYIISGSSKFSNYSFLTPIIGIGMISQGFFTLLVQVHNSYDNNKLTTLMWGICAFINLLTNLLLLPIIGVIAAALATLIAFTTGAGLAWFMSPVKLTFGWSKTAKSVFASILMYFFVRYTVSVIKIGGIIDIGMVVFSGIVIYSLIAISTGIVSKAKLTTLVES